MLQKEQWCIFYIAAHFLKEKKKKNQHRTWEYSAFSHHFVS